MSPGVDAYLAWTPAGMAGAADWLKGQSTLMDDSARTIRDAAEAGTEGQSGSFIASRQQDAAEQVKRIEELADILLAAGQVVRRTGTALESAVGRLRSVESQLLGEGFQRVEGEHVGDRRTGYADATERHQRETRAGEFREQLWDLLHEIREVDDQANRELHEIVNRDVRDRTALGNGEPQAVMGSLLDSTTFASALGGTFFAGVRDTYELALAASSRGSSVGWWNLARGGGAVFSVLGFMGAVANAPEDEPLFETLMAEGAGTLAGAGGSTLGCGLGAPLPVIGPLVGHFTGGIAAGMWASSAVRSRFDRAN